MNLDGTPHVNRSFLKGKGLTDAEIAKIEKTLPGTFELSSAFSKFTMGDALLKRIGVSDADLAKPTFNFLTWAGMTEKSSPKPTKRSAAR